MSFASDDIVQGLQCRALLPDCHPLLSSLKSILWLLKLIAVAAATPERHAGV
jgi:hypothetical protein